MEMEADLYQRCDGTLPYISSVAAMSNNSRRYISSDVMHNSSSQLQQQQQQQPIISSPTSPDNPAGYQQPWYPPAAHSFHHQSQSLHHNNNNNFHDIRSSRNESTEKQFDAINGFIRERIELAAGANVSTNLFAGEVAPPDYGDFRLNTAPTNGNPHDDFVAQQVVAERSILSAANSLHMPSVQRVPSSCSMPLQATRSDVSSASSAASSLSERCLTDGRLAAPQAHCLHPGQQQQQQQQLQQQYDITNNIINSCGSNYQGFHQLPCQQLQSPLGSHGALRQCSFSAAAAAAAAECHDVMFRNAAAACTMASQSIPFVPPNTLRFDGLRMMSSNGVSTECDGAGRKKRRPYSRYQIAVLENEFIASQYIGRQRRWQISSQLQLTERQVKVWFQNRRMKGKKLNDRAQLMTPAIIKQERGQY